MSYQRICDVMRSHPTTWRHLLEDVTPCILPDMTLYHGTCDMCSTSEYMTSLYSGHMTPCILPHIASQLKKYVTSRVLRPTTWRHFTDDVWRHVFYQAWRHIPGRVTSCVLRQTTWRHFTDDVWRHVFYQAWRHIAGRVTSCVLRQTTWRHFTVDMTSRLKGQYCSQSTHFYRQISILVVLCTFWFWICYASLCWLCLQSTQGN